MTNHNIDLPSKRVKGMYDYHGNLMIEIEKPLRRQFRTRKTDYIAYLYWFLILGLIVCTILHFFVEPHIISTAHAAEPGTLEYFCQTGIAGHEIDPKALSANYRELCD